MYILNHNNQPNIYNNYQKTHLAKTNCCPQKDFATYPPIKGGSKSLILGRGIDVNLTNTQMPTSTRNYCLFDNNKVDCFVKQKENSLPYLSDILAHSNNEMQIVETLYIVDRMIDNGVKGIDKMYPILARFNNTTSPNIQTFLAGIYRKTQVPDGFGPLIKMLIQNSLHPQASNFDPNEEIGGAILAYLSDRFRH